MAAKKKAEFPIDVSNDDLVSSESLTEDVFPGNIIDASKYPYLTSILLFVLILQK